MSSFAAGTPQHSTLWLVVRCSRRATRQRCGHRHAGAVRRTSVSLAFCCPRTCVRGQHLIVPPTNAANAAARMQSQTRTKNSTNPSHLSSKQTPHISHSPAYKNTNPSHFAPHPHSSPTPPLQPCIYIYKPLTFHTPIVPRVPLSPTPGSRLPAPGSMPASIPALTPTLPVRPHPPSPQAPATLPPLHICQHICPSALVHCIRSFSPHPHQRLPRASIHPALACACKRREERGRLCRISGA
jgi:hypothetical protein